MYIVGSRRTPTAVAAVHGEVFREIRPAATLVVVSRLITPSLLVEVEADARKGLTARPALAGHARAERAGDRHEPDAHEQPEQQVPAPDTIARHRDADRARSRRAARRAPSGFVTTRVLTAASDASTAGPTSRR